MATRNQLLDQPILESAKQEFLSKGFEKASLKEICKNAGVTTGAIYKRYKDKEDLFAAVVNDTIQDLKKLIDEKCHVDVKKLSDEVLIKSWDMDESYMMWWFQYLFEHYDGFVLLLKCAETTRYANFAHDWVEEMTEVTYQYYQEAYKRKLTQKQIPKAEMHILLSAYWTTIYEPFIHGFTFEQIEAHSHLVCHLFEWSRTIGFQK